MYGFNFWLKMIVLFASQREMEILLQRYFIRIAIICKVLAGMAGWWDDTCRAKDFL